MKNIDVGRLIQFLRFAATGSLQLGCSFAMFALIIWMRPEISLTIPLLTSYIFGASAGYLVNSVWTFRSSPSFSGFVLYLAGYIPSYLVNELVLRGRESSEILFTQLIFLVIMTIANYFIQRFLAFRRKPPKVFSVRT